MPEPSPSSTSHLFAAVAQRVLFTAALFTSIAGCTMAKASLSKDDFSRQVTSLLAGKDAVVVPASALTEFAWDALCFERDDTLQLRFRSGDSEQVLSLPYEEFFVDEGHVENSLEDACVAPGDRIRVRKKYPGYQGPIEFQKADKDD